MCLLGCGRELNVAVNDGFRRKPPEMRSLWFCKVKLDPSPKATGSRNWIRRFLGLPFNSPWHGLAGEGTHGHFPVWPPGATESIGLGLPETQGDPQRLKKAKERTEYLALLPPELPPKQEPDFVTIPVWGKRPSHFCYHSSGFPCVCRVF